jgi:hypothetical protein
MALVFRHGRPRYQQSIRVGGWVTTHYRGSGDLAVLLHDGEVLERRHRAEMLRIQQGEAREKAARDERAITDWFAEVEVIARAALVATGHRMHKGQWRRRRVPANPA